MEDTLVIPQGEPAKATAATARTRFAGSVLAGILLGIAAGSRDGWRYAPLVAWDAAALIYIAWAAWSLRGKDAKQTADLAVREDPGDAAADIILILASLASLVAVGAFLLQAGSTSGSTKLWNIALGTFSVVVSWVLVHTIFTLRYAREYYRGGGGIDFGHHAPCFADFAYLAFTIGMTFQVSDTSFKNSRFRQLALRHAMLSYVFGTVVVATTINLVAGLAK